MFFCLSMIRPRPRSTLFPYTTLFRSARELRKGTHPRRHPGGARHRAPGRSEEHTSELQSRLHLVCRLLLEKKKEGEHHALAIAQAWASSVAITAAKQQPRVASAERPN